MNKTLILFLLTFIFIVSKCYSQSDRWVYLSLGEDYSIYYDKETVKYDDNKITVFLKSIYFEDSKRYGDFKYAIVKTELYCGKITFIIIQ